MSDKSQEEKLLELQQTGEAVGKLAATRPPLPARLKPFGRRTQKPSSPNWASWDYNRSAG